MKRQSFWERNRKSRGMLLKRTMGQGAVSVIRALLLFGLCFMIIQPLLMKLSVSLMEERDLYDSTVTLLPNTAVKRRTVCHVREISGIRTIACFPTSRNWKAWAWPPSSWKVA